MERARGFTLIEVLLAIMVFAVGVLGAAVEMAALTRALARAQRAALVAAAAAARLERLRDAACFTRVDGTETVRRGRIPLATLSWSWSAVADSTYGVRLVTTPVLGVGGRQPPADTLALTILCRR